MIRMSATERDALNKRLSAITEGHVPEMNKTAMAACGYKLINDDKDTAGMALVTEESSETAFSFMYKIFGEDPFLTK